MDNSVKTCQNCGVPLNQDPNGGGTNSDGSVSDIYCSFCFQNGAFTHEGASVRRKVVNLIENAKTNLGMTECQAKEVADNYCAKLVRWK